MYLVRLLLKQIIIVFSFAATVCENFTFNEEYGGEIFSDEVAAMKLMLDVGKAGSFE